MTTPGSPSRSSPRRATAVRDGILNDLSSRWGLVIQSPKEGESPSKRLEKLSIARKAENYSAECFFKIHFLSLKDEAALSTALDAFHCAAGRLQSGWVYKPNADDDLLPGSARSKPLVTATQREQLFQCLLSSITPAFEQAKGRQVNRAKGNSDLIYSVSSPEHVLERHVVDEQFDDTPIPFSLDGNGRAKRRSDGDEVLNDVSKRTKGRLDEAASQRIVDVVDSVPVVIRQAGYDAWSSTTRPTIVSSANNIPATTAFKVPNLPRNIISDDRNQRRQDYQPETANTSFTSNASVLSSVFDEDLSDASDESFFSTQTSVMDTSYDRRGMQEQEIPAETEHAQYENSIDDFEMVDPISLEPEYLLRERLQNIFPTQPAFLQDVPLAIRYEITRVCSHAKVPINDLQFPKTDFSNLRNYDGLWNFLKSQPALRGKDFPEKSDHKAWTSSLEKFQRGFCGVILSATLKFNDSQEGPFFTFQLQPLKHELSHRLSRRFGNDRFLEISIPSFSGSRLPRLLKDAQHSGHGEGCRKAIVEWITREKHNFLGRDWQSFFIKDGTKKKSKLRLSPDEELDKHSTCTVYLFAIDGVGYQSGKTIPPVGEPHYKHTRMDVATMIQWLIPFEQNRQQMFLKLFARIALGLTKTYKTVELKPSEIRYHLHDLESEETKEVMNDGCGRISRNLATNVVQCLGLNYVPSGFQARIGGAKGFWIVDHNDHSEETWIDIYPSQVKWKYSPEVTDLAQCEASHRTFEVVNWVKPLKSAALNLQLIPLLEDRGKSPQLMREAISQLLVNGLTHEIQVQRAAMDSPQKFRKWVRENNSGIEDRIKHGQVPYVAGIPRSLEEQLNMLLDAGFDPQRLKFLRDLAWRAYTQKCDMLKKKLKITVGRSTYAFIAVDFTGTLEPDEVCLNFSSNFTDDASNFCDTCLDGIDVLVARCPAHHISDIQKVKAVWKRELKALKDVLVFSSKGNIPLAKKLSGGDYDGDTAWICFEPTIVNEFVNADTPDSPDLIKLGYIQKEERRYSDIASVFVDPIPVFLQYSFDFNFQDSLLGICTIHKEAFCYTYNSVNSSEAVFLSTLLSDLVDQRKQGYTFNMQSWERVRCEVLRAEVREPNYKRDKLERKSPREHIIDYLKFIVAEKVVEETLTAFHESLARAEYWDDDVVKLAQWAKELARESPDWGSLVQKLEHDIKAVKQAWRGRFKRERNPEAMVNFTSIVTELYGQWQAISPPPGNPLSQALAPSCLPSAELSTFALLKASLGFSLCSRAYVSNFIWWMAGKQLAVLKAMCGGEDSGGGSGGGGGGGGTGIGIAVVAPHMYAMLRPDATYVKLMHSQDHDPRFWEAKAESVVPDEDMESGEWEEDEVGG